MRITPHRICLFPGTIGEGGIGMVMLALAKGFVDRGIAVDLALAGSLPSQLQAGRSIPEGVRVIQLSSRARGSLYPLIRYIRREKPDMIISARDYINVIALLARRISGIGSRCRLIWTFHTHRSSQLSSMRFIDRLFDWIVCKCIRIPDARVTVAEGISQDLSKKTGVPLDRFRVIDNPGWSSARAFLAQLPCTHPWLEMRKAGQRDPNAPIILGIGRFVEQKDFKNLIDAFSLFKIKQPNARLILLGSGPEEVALREHVRLLDLHNSIDFPGFVENPLSYLARADLFALSSRWEGQPIALIEALGCGCPVVSTNCPTGPDYILRDGIGVLVPPEDSISLAKGMMKALHEPPHPEKVRARVAHFSPDRAVADYLELY